MSGQSDQSNLARGVCTGAKVSGLVNVLVGAQTMVAQCPQDLTVAAGDPVLMAKFGGSWHITQRYYTTGIGNILSDLNQEPPTVPVVRTGTNNFIPVRTASYRNGAWRTDNDHVYQGQYGGAGNHVGCAFYGTQIKTLAGAKVLKAHMHVRRRQGGSYAGQSTTMVHVAEFAKPSGAPTIGGAYIGPKMRVGATDVAFAIDITLAQALVDGTYGGIGFYVASGSPYVIFTGIGEYAASMALTISWRKTS